MPEQDELDTQVDEQELEEVEQEQDDQGDESGNSDSDPDAHRRQARKPFLVVDERTQYATREDAIKGIGEAGKRIAALSAWEKELKEYGDLNPSDVRAYLDELIESRQSAEELRSELKKLKEEREKAEHERKENSSQTRVQNESKLTREEKDAIEWLKDKLPSLGYISKEDAMKLVKDLQDQLGGDRLSQMESRISQQEAAFRTGLIEDSRSKLKAQLKEDGFSDDEEGSLQMLIENNLRAWIDGDPTGRRSAKFYQGGAVKDALIQEGYEKIKKALGLVRTTQSSTYAKSKAEALKRNVKRLPTQGGEKNTPSSQVNRGQLKKRFNASGKRDYISEKHNEAWEVAQRYFSNEANQE